MKRTIVDPTLYAFDASQKTVTLAGYTSVFLAGLIFITNTVDGIVIFNCTDPLKGATAAGNVFTLDYDTSLMSDSDPLQIIYDDGLAHPLTLSELQSQTINVRLPADTTIFTDFDDQSIQPTVIKPEIYGQLPAAESIPVTLAKEQVFDLQAPLAVFMAPVAGIVIAIQDCLQYRSIALQLITGVGISAGVVSFEGSNDGAGWVAVTLLDQASVNSVGISTITLAASTNRFLTGPLSFRWFRARISTTVAGGQVGVLPIYRMAPFAFATCVDNMAQWGGTAVVTGGVAGIPAVGGNVAVALAPTANPVTIGGVDTTALAPLIRRIVTDTYGNLVAVGPGPFRPNANPVTTTDAPSDGAHVNDSDLQQAMLLQLTLLNYYFKQFLEYQMPGQTFDDIETFKQSNQL